MFVLKIKNGETRNIENKIKLYKHTFSIVENISNDLCGNMLKQCICLF